jgi:hypothetical protein
MGSFQLSYFWGFTPASCQRGSSIGMLALLVEMAENPNVSLGPGKTDVELQSVTLSYNLQCDELADFPNQCVKPKLTINGADHWTL